MTALLIVYRLVLQRSAGPDIPTRWPRRVGRGYESRIPQQLPTGTFSPAVRLPVGEEWHRQCEGYGDHETTGHAAQRRDGGGATRRRHDAAPRVPTFHGHRTPHIVGATLRPPGAARQG